MSRCFAGEPKVLYITGANWVGPGPADPSTWAYNPFPAGDPSGPSEWANPYEKPFPWLAAIAVAVGAYYLVTR